jgi:hypothetical protein
MYFVVALSNPGRLIGDQAEVEMKSRSYNPEHYVIDESASNDAESHHYASSVFEHDQTKHQRQTALTKGFQVSRHERPKTPT